jgi:hypothetical protein
MVKSLSVDLRCPLAPIRSLVRCILTSHLRVKGLRKQVRKATKSIEFSNKDGNIHQANQKKQDRDATPRLLNNRQWKLGDQERYVH